MPDVMHLIRLHASPELVYRSLTTAEGIRSWWTRDATLESRVGGTGEFGFNEHRTLAKVRIEELKAPVRVGWKTMSCTIREWEGTTIAFDLDADGDDTVLSFAHRGFERAGELYAKMTTGWGYHLLSLKRYLETGKGAPHPEDSDDHPFAKKAAPAIDASPAPSDDISAIVSRFGGELSHPARPFALLARFRIKNGTEARVEAAFGKSRAATLGEAGVLAFYVNRGAKDATRLTVYERWKSLADFEAHLRTRYVKALRAELEPLIVGAPEFDVLLPAGE